MTAEEVRAEQRAEGVGAAVGAGILVTVVTGGRTLPILSGLVAKIAPQTRGLGNPFKGKTQHQAAKMMERKGFSPKGPSPETGKGGYVNPKTGRSYHVDSGQRPAPRRSEPPHVDVNRDSNLTRPTPGMPKRKFELEE